MQTAQNKGPAILFLIPAALVVAVIVIAARMMMADTAQSWPAELIVANCVQLRPAELTHSDFSYHKAANKLKEPAVNNNKNIEQSRNKKARKKTCIIIAWYFFATQFYSAAAAHILNCMLFSPIHPSLPALFSFSAVCGAFVDCEEKRVEN